MSRPAVICVALLLAARGCQAGGVTVTASVDRQQVAVGETFTYVLSVNSQNGQTQQPQPPDFKDFQARPGGTSTSLNIVNGVVQMTASATFELGATREGTFTLGPAKLAVGTDVVDELEGLCLSVARKFPKARFFAGQLMFQRDVWYQHLLHNYTAFALQRRLHWQGLSTVIVPTRIFAPRPGVRPPESLANRTATATQPGSRRGL